MKLFSVERARVADEVRLDPEHFLLAQISLSQGASWALSEVANLMTATWSPGDLGADTITYIDISAVDTDSGVIKEPKVIAASEAPARARRLVQAGDLLVSTVRPDRGAIAIVPKALDGAVASTGFAVLRPHKTTAAVLWAWLRSEPVRKQLSLAATGSLYPTLKQGHLLDVRIPHHTHEQFKSLERQVMAMVNQTDASDADQESASFSLREAFGLKVDAPPTRLYWVKREQLSAERLDPEYFQPHGRALVNQLSALRSPVAPLGEVAEILSGAPTQKCDPGQGVAIIRPRNLRDGVLDLSSLSEALLLREAPIVQAGDVLVSVIGTEAGKAAAVTSEATGLAFDNNLVLLRPRGTMEPAYLALYFNSDLGRALLDRLSASYGLLRRLSVKSLSELPVVLPSLTDQAAYVSASQATSVSSATGDHKQLDELADEIACMLTHA